MYVLYFEHYCSNIAAQVHLSMLSQSSPFPILRTIFFFHWLLSHISIVETMDSDERGMNPVAMSIINSRKEYQPSRGSNQLPCVLKSCTPAIEYGLGTSCKTGVLIYKSLLTLSQTSPFLRVCRASRLSNEQFFLFPTAFSTHLENFPPFSINLELSSTNSFSLKESKFCRLVKSKYCADSHCPTFSKFETVT